MQEAASICLAAWFAEQIASRQGRHVPTAGRFTCAVQADSIVHQIIVTCEPYCGYTLAVRGSFQVHSTGKVTEKRCVLVFKQPVCSYACAAFPWYSASLDSLCVHVRACVCNLLDRALPIMDASRRGGRPPAGRQNLASATALWWVLCLSCNPYQHAEAGPAL